MLSIEREREWLNERGRERERKRELDSVLHPDPVWDRVLSPFLLLFGICYTCVFGTSVILNEGPFDTLSLFGCLSIAK